MAQLTALFDTAGLVEVYADEQGREMYRLTDEGVQVGNMLALVERALLSEPADRSTPKRALRRDPQEEAAPLGGTGRFAIRVFGSGP
jgi:hypothetical protein